MKFSVVFLFLLAHFAFAQEGIILDFKIEGNSKLKSSFIKKISNIKSGVKLDSMTIEGDIKRLKRLPSIAHAYYQVFSAGEASYNVLYTIEENFTIIPSANVYTTNNGEFAYRLGLYEFNLFGRNMTFGGFYQKDIYSSYALNFRAPFLFSRQLH